MSDAIPTVTIVHPENPEDSMVVNEAEYDPEEHTLWADKDKPEMQAQMKKQQQQRQQRQKAQEQQRKQQEKEAAQQQQRDKFGRKPGNGETEEPMVQAVRSVTRESDKPEQQSAPPHQQTEEGMGPTPHVNRGIAGPPAEPRQPLQSAKAAAEKGMTPEAKQADAKAVQEQKQAAREAAKEKE